MIKKFLNENEQTRQKEEESKVRRSSLRRFQVFVLFYAIFGMICAACSHFLGWIDLEKDSFEQWIILWPYKIFNLIF